MDIRSFYGDIKQKSLVLFGEQEEIIHFLDRYHELLNVHMVITEYVEEYRTQPYMDWNISTILLKDAELLSDELIIICDKTSFDMRKRRLNYIGKSEYKHYISCELFEHILYQKKLMVCMGTQLISQICLFINKCKEFTSQYSVIFFPECQLMEPYENRMQEYIHVCRCCSVYVRSSCEKERFPLKIINKSVLDGTCRIITIADYGFGGYYPQIDKNRDIISDYLLREHERMKIDYETLAFSRTDKEVLDLCEKGMATDDIVDKLTSTDFYSLKAVADYFEDEVNQFKQQESSADIKLGEFIHKYKNDYLCRNLNEWNEPVITYASNLLLQILNIPALTLDLKTRKTLIEENSGSEIIVYPSVQRALGLEDVLKNKKYRVVTYYGVKYMMLEEYLYYILNYLLKAKDLMEFTGMSGDRLIENN